MIGGSGRWLWEIYQRFPRRNIIIAAGVNPAQEDFDRSHDLRLIRIPLRIRPPRFDAAGESGEVLEGAGRAWTAGESEKIDIIHCGCCLPEGVMALALKLVYGIPYVCYAHGEEFEFAMTSRELTWLALRVLHGAEFVVANSHNTSRVLTERWGVTPDHARVMHPGVDTGRFRPAPHDRVPGSVGLGGSSRGADRGPAAKSEGHDQMIPAVGMLRETIPDILYAVAGDGNERKSLEDLVARTGSAGHVQFLGELGEDDLIRCYQQCDLFVLPNRQVGRDVEGFGIVLLEAQACGKPVVAGAAGGTAETMSMPQTGFVVPANRPNSRPRWSPTCWRTPAGEPPWGMPRASGSSSGSTGPF